MSLRFTLRQLEYFVAVGEAGSIALASDKVNVSSPSISAAIGQLEDGQPLRGAGEFAAFAERILGAFSGIHFVVEDAFGAGDKVVARWSATMTHTGDHLGMPATGKQVRLTGISVVCVSEGKFVEGWDSWDQLGLMKQLGVYQPPEAALLKSA